MAATSDRRVSRTDIDAKLREIKGEVDQAGEAARPYGIAAAVGGAILVLLFAYLLGRRRGKKKTTIVEIRRV